MAYLIHFNPNHDKLGRFTFSSGKDLYKSIRRDVRRGEFDPKKYKSNESINKAINDNKLVARIKNRDKLLKEYNSQQKDIRLQNELYEKLNADRNKRAQKYYKEMLKGKTKLTDAERYNIFEKAMQKAEDEDYSNPKYLETIGVIDNLVGNQSSNKTFQDILNANYKTATTYDNAVKEVLGKYNDKKIFTLKSNDRASRYVSSIIDEILLDQDAKIRR